MQWLLCCVRMMWTRLLAVKHLLSLLWLQTMQDYLRHTLLCVQAEANMHDEMFGHLLAAMRFGADEAACLAAIQVAFR